MSYSLAYSQAILTVLYVADKVQQGYYDFVPTKQLSEDLNIARPSAVKILRSLSNAGLIETREGAKGGVRLAVAPPEITLLDVFQAVEAGKPLFRQDFQMRVSGVKPTRAQVEVLDVFDSAELAMQEVLKQRTIADMIKKLNE